jgi:hypothetical protein
MLLPGIILSNWLEKGTSVAPFNIAVKISHKLKSKPKLENCPQQSPAFTLYSFVLQARKFSNPFLVIITPLGRPVDPEVNIT